MLGPDRVNRYPVHCRTGSLEMQRDLGDLTFIVHCRTGSLETYTKKNPCALDRSLPYRQLRKARLRS